MVLKAGTMNQSDANETTEIRTALETRCQVRLDKDLRDLLKANCERMRVTVQRFGNHVEQVAILFPGLRTAFINKNTREKIVCRQNVIAIIIPNAHEFPFPLGEPAVMLLYPDLQPPLAPYLGGVKWFPGPDGKNIGLPCLWRVWSPQNHGLLFVAQQVYRLLTVDGVKNAPTDSPNRDAATYWVEQKDFKVPLDDRFETLCGTAPVREAANGFKLSSLEER